MTTAASGAKQFLASSSAEQRLRRLPHVARTGISWGLGVLLSRIYNVFFFALWVAVCAAAPEFVWQGLFSLFGHFTWRDAAAALLIGAILAFFVEPLVERLRSFVSAQPAHPDKNPAFAACTALSFAMAVVCIHEAITTYVAASHANEQANQNLTQAVLQVLQWAAIPFAITVAWLAARSKPWCARAVTLLALLAIYLTGYGFGWSGRVIFTTGLPCALILAGGYASLRRQWDQRTFRRCAYVTAVTALAWLAVTGVLQAGLSLGRVRTFTLYDWSEFWIDCRFYVGWVVGLIVAPGFAPVERTRTNGD